MCILAQLFFSSFLVEDVVGLKYLRANAPTLPDDSDKSFIFVFAIVLLFSIIRYTYLKFEIAVPISTVMIVIGILWGIAGRHFSALLPYSSVIFATSMLSVFYPVICFRTAFFIDMPNFMKSLSQILIISLPVTLAYACLVGFGVSHIANYFWTPLFCIHFGMLTAPTFPSETVNYLQAIGFQTKNMRILLEGESIVDLMITMLLSPYRANGLLNVDYNMSKFKYILWQFFYTLQNLLFGLVSGFCASYIMKRNHTHSSNLALVCLVMPLFCYYIADTFLGSNGSICVFIIGLMMNVQRQFLPNEMNADIVSLWKIFSLVEKLVVYISSGTLFSLYILEYMDLQDYIYVFLTYVVCNFARFVSFLLFAPILSRVGYGITFRNMLIIFWGGLKSPVLLMIVSVQILTSINVQSTTIINVQTARIIAMHIISLVLLTSLINGTSTPRLLKVTKISKISKVKLINMNNRMANINAQREHIISVLKMDRFFADANWPVVCTATELKHPYEMKQKNMKSIQSISHEDDSLEKNLRYVFCPDCNKEVVDEPTLKEFKEMTREARVRVLKYKKGSYIRQYEKGMISIPALRALLQAVYVAMDTEKALIELDELHTLFLKETCLHRCVRYQIENVENTLMGDIQVPRKYSRKICFEIVSNDNFKIFMFAAIVLSLVPTTVEFIIPNVSLEENFFYLVINAAFFTLYLIEFVLKVLGYSFISIWKHGVKTYFRSYMNGLDFVVLCLMFMDVVVETVITIISPRHNLHSILAALQYVRLVRVLKLVNFLTSAFPILTLFAKARINEHLTYSFEIAKGYVNGEDDTLENIANVIDNEKIKEDMTNKLKHDRLEIKRLLGTTQNDMLWVATTAKTKQAIRTILNVMRLAILELKAAGRIDSFEFLRLIESLYERFQYLNAIRFVESLSFKSIFDEIHVLAVDREVTDFIYENIKTRKFKTGDSICTQGRITEGIFIIVTGFFKLTYTPRKQVLDNLTQHGLVPIVDYMPSSRLKETWTDYLLIGNSVGYLGLLTGRPYDCNILADSPCQVCFISRDFVKRAFAMKPDPLNGLECRMWKLVGIRIALSVLNNVPIYQSWDIESLKLLLGKSMVPQISAFKMFTLTGAVEDIVLIEGVVMDNDTKQLYIAPTYIPRNVQKILLPPSGKIKLNRDIDSKLLIIPIDGIHEFGLVLREEGVCELNVSDSGKCLQHATFKSRTILTDNRITKYMKKKKPNRISWSTQFVPKSESSKSMQSVKELYRRQT